MKNLLLILLTFLSLPAFCQDSTYFELTPEGFVNKVAPEKKDVVINIPDHKQKELYTSAIRYLSTLYVSPQDVLSKVENESVTVNGSVNNLSIYGNKAYGTLFEYTYTVQFKDSKIRILSPSINRIFDGSSSVYLLGSRYGAGIGIFKEKNKQINLEYAKASIEKHINDTMSNLVNELKSGKSNNW